MQQIVNFILRNKVFLLYIFLFFLSFAFTIQTHSFHKSKFINSANFLTGGIYNTSNNINSYFGLKEQNTLLQNENNRLRSLLLNTESKDNIDSNLVTFSKQYKTIPAQIIKNSYTLQNNIVLINKGSNDSILHDYGVITSKGILGVIDNTSGNYSTVISILNTSSKISAKLKKTDHYGSLTWNGRASGTVQLIEVPVKANVKFGDTIVTSGFSQIFPKGIPIGTVKDYTPDAAENYYTINVKLFNDMTSIEHVYIIGNNDKDEINTLINNE